MPGELYVGLDVHKLTTVATVLDPEGHRIDQAKLGSSDAELIRYLNQFSARKQVVLEACNVWPHVYDAARAAGAEVTLAHPYKVRVISEASLKSDRVDSQALAQLLRLRAVPMAFAPDPATRELRQLVRDRAFYKRQETSVKNHIYAALLLRGILYEQGLLGLKGKGEELRDFHLSEVDRGLDVLANIDATCQEMDRQVHDAFLASREAQLLASIPGIGEFTALALVAEIGPIDRFPNVEKFCSYVGLVPRNFQSGERSYQGHLKSDCNEMAQWLLVEASWTHRQWARNDDTSKFVKRVIRRRGKKVGNVAGAHKLAKIVYAVFRRGTPYTPERPSPETSSAES
jgi:transposase